MSTEDAMNFEDEQWSDALPTGSRLLSGQYEIQRYLSSGGFGITYLAKDSLNRTVVIKECFPEAFCRRVNKTVRARTQNYIDDFRSSVDLFIKEAHALSKLQHASVVGVHQVFEDNETAYMALDLIEGQDLLEIIETGIPKMPPEAVRKMTLKLLDAISHVHSRDLLHRDISPDNILVDKTGHPVLIDFGAAREEASRKSRVLSAVMVVKDGYSPQEFYVAGSQQHPCSDLYALAATLVHLITGQAPPNSQVRLAAMANKQADPYVPLRGRFQGYEDGFLTAIDTAMNISPVDRLQSAEEWVLQIDHSKRQAQARVAAERDKSIDQTVMDLVKSERLSIARARRHSPDMYSPTENDGASPPQDQQRQNDFDQATFEITRGTQKTHEGEAEDAVSATNAPVACAQPRAETVRPTPYVRVASRARAVSRQKKLEPEKPEQGFWGSGARPSRFATVPVVFGAYFFYAHTAFQIEKVQVLTIEPLVAFSEQLSDFSFSSGDTRKTSVVVRRGLGE
ncbi:MAG: serine/threonine-protein kinase [Pseudomonadota bacterium]